MSLVSHVVQSSGVMQTAVTCVLSGKRNTSSQVVDVVFIMPSSNYTEQLGGMLLMPTGQYKHSVEIFVKMKKRSGMKKQCVSVEVLCGTTVGKCSLQLQWSWATLHNSSGSSLSSSGPCEVFNLIQDRIWRVKRSRTNDAALTKNRKWKATRNIFYLIMVWSMLPVMLFRCADADFVSSGDVTR